MHWSKKSLFALALDLLLIAIAWSLAFWLRFNLDTPDDFQAMMLQTLPAPLLSYGTSLLLWRVYRHIAHLGHQSLAFRPCEPGKQGLTFRVCIVFAQHCVKRHNKGIAAVGYVLRRGGDPVHGK